MFILFYQDTTFEMEAVVVEVVEGTGDEIEMLVCFLRRLRYRNTVVEVVGLRYRICRDNNSRRKRKYR